MKSDELDQNLPEKISKDAFEDGSSWKPDGRNKEYNGDYYPPPVVLDSSEENMVTNGKNNTSARNQNTSFDKFVPSAPQNLPEHLYKPSVARNFPRPRVPSSPELIHKLQQQRKFFSPYPGRAVLVCVAALVSLSTPSRAPTFLTIPVQFVALAMIVLHILLVFIWLFGVNGAASKIYTPTEEEYNKIKDNFASSETVPVMPYERKEVFRQKVGSF